jgi:hypothetical protein
MEERAGPGEAPVDDWAGRLRRRNAWVLAGAVAITLVGGVVVWRLLSADRSNGSDYTAGPGISSAVADQVKREFPEDQAALYQAVATNDAGAA